MDIIIAGFGGQGILFAGKVLAYAALLSGYQLSWLPSYGPEMRGGTANCHVIISDEKVGSPIITEPDILISMNRPSLDKFEHTVKRGGTAFIDSTLIDRLTNRNDIKAVYIPATQAAINNKTPNLANMVMLGATMKHTNMFSQEIIEDSINHCISKPELTKLDMDAIKLGYNL